MRDSEGHRPEHQAVEEKAGGDMAMSSNGRLSLALSLLLFLVSACAAQAPPKFPCSDIHNCQALAGFVPPTETTYEAIRALFQVGSIYDLYGANGLNETTPTSTKVPANATVRVPFPCACANGTGVSDRKPVYTAKSGDSLQKIAGETFGGLVTHQQIAAANGISNASSSVIVGKRLFIPIPCSCDYVGYSAVIHLAHVLKKETNLAEISKAFFAFPETLLRFNNISGTQSLVPGQVLDVPLHACSSSSIHALSPDLGLLLLNGTYALTARNCIKCSCDRPADEVSCERSPDWVASEGCSLMPCYADDSERSLIAFGARYASQCGVTQCVYGGYDERMVWSTTSTLRYSDCGELPAIPSTGERPTLHSWSLLPLLPLLAFLG